MKLAAAIEPADIVTLDRVVCCYPDAEALVGGSAARVRTVYGLVLPRDRFMVRIAIRLENLWIPAPAEGISRLRPPDAQRVDEIVDREAGSDLARNAKPSCWRVIASDRRRQRGGRHDPAAAI